MGRGENPLLVYRSDFGRKHLMKKNDNDLHRVDDEYYLRLHIVRTDPG